MVQRRARQVHEKEERRQSILAAGLELLEGSSFQAITMEQVARESRLAKGTIFLYFTTKEELFLSLTETRLLRFFEFLDEGLGSAPMEMDPTAFSGLVRDAIESQPILVRLLSILHPVLEHNVDRLILMRFKEFMATRLTRSARLIEKRMPKLGKGDGIHLLFQIYALLLGSAQMSDPSPVLRGVLAAPGLDIFEIPFGSFFQRAVERVVMGVLAPSTTPTSPSENQNAESPKSKPSPKGVATGAPWIT